MSLSVYAYISVSGLAPGLQTHGVIICVRMWSKSIGVCHCYDGRLVRKADLRILAVSSVRVCVW